MEAVPIDPTDKVLQWIVLYYAQQIINELILENNWRFIELLKPADPEMHDGVTERDLPVYEVSRPSTDMYRRRDQYMSINPDPDPSIRIPVLVIQHLSESK